MAPRGGTPCPSGFMCGPRVQELCLKRFSGRRVRGGAEAITNGAAALQVCCTHPNAVLYQPMLSGGHVIALLTCVRVH